MATAGNLSSEKARWLGKTFAQDLRKLLPVRTENNLGTEGARL